MVCAKRTQSFTIRAMYAVTVFVAHSMLSAFFSVQIALRQSSFFFFKFVQHICNLMLNSRRPSSAGFPMELGRDAPRDLRRRLHKSMVGLIVEASSHRLWEKQTQTLISTTCQRISGAASSSKTWVPLKGRMKFGKLRILISRFLRTKA